MKYLKITVTVPSKQYIKGGAGYSAYGHTRSKADLVREFIANVAANGNKVYHVVFANTFISECDQEAYNEAQKKLVDIYSELGIYYTHTGNTYRIYIPTPYYKEGLNRVAMKNLKHVIINK